MLHKKAIVQLIVGGGKKLWYLYLGIVQLTWKTKIH